MAPLTVTLPDGTTKELAAGATARDLAADIGRRLAKDALAATVNGVEVDLDRPLPDGATVAIVTPASDGGRAVLRHSTAHVLAQAVLRLWPGAHFAIGPVIEDGFYYDFELPGGAHFSDDDLQRIDATMREIIAEDQPFVRHEHSIDEGLALFGDQPFKQEIIEAVGAGANEVDAVPADQGPPTVSTYWNAATFTDLCRGPHVPSTRRLGHFALMRVAGAYWRGDEKRPQLQRIYGTAWESAEALAAHLYRLEEAERRDHRKLGAELDLFSFPDEIGSGLPVFHPRGGIVRRVMEDYSRQRHEAAGYVFVNTPHITKANLFETSGHLDWFAEGMFPPMELDGGQIYYLKPMNCPFHVLIFKSRQRSYRELPIRMFEFGSVYRYEKSGVVHGLTRVRGMTQDDAHLFCTREQMADELHTTLTFVLSLLRDFGLEDFYLELSTRPEGKAVGSDEEWAEATETLRSTALAMDLDLVLDEGGGAFYGPKISVQAKDAIGRTHQMSTIQLDFQTPQRFGAEYVGRDNARHRPIMIHRALFGSVERFFAILLEHYAGALPTWLAPEQVRVLGVRDDHAGYVDKVADRLEAVGARVASVPADEPLGARIRQAKLEKVPYILVVGDDDVAAGTVGVNRRGSDRPERGVALADFTEGLEQEIAERGVARAGRVPVSLEVLWAGWRHAYVQSHADDETAPGVGSGPGPSPADAPDPGDDPAACVFCRLAASGPPSAENGVLWADDEIFCVLNAYPYAPGHLMVLPRRHVGTLGALTEEEGIGVWRGLRAAVAALETAYRPDGVNVGANLGRAAGAGIPRHVHLHALPRWSGDTNFMTSVASARVMPEDLVTSWERLVAAWPA